MLHAFYILKHCKHSIPAHGRGLVVAGQRICNFFEYWQAGRLKPIYVDVLALQIVKEPLRSVLHVFAHNVLNALLLVQVPLRVNEKAPITVAAQARVLQKLLAHGSLVLFVQVSLRL